MTTTDPQVVFGIVLTTSGAYLLLALLLKHLLDEYSAPSEARHGPAGPSATTSHARPAAPDETAPITTVQSCPACNRKGTRWN